MRFKLEFDLDVREFWYASSYKLNPKTIGKILLTHGEYLRLFDGVALNASTVIRDKNSNAIGKWEIVND